MSKLFKLRDWFTIKDAAAHLSSAMSEPVTEADVLRLVMDGHLAVSLFLGHDQFAAPNLTILDEEAEDHSWKAPGEYVGIERWDEFDDNKVRGSTVRLWPGDRFYNLLRGVHDFPLWGKQKSLIEREYFKLTGGPNIDRATSIFVLMNEQSPNPEPMDGKEYFAMDGRRLMRLMDMKNGKAEVLRELPEHSLFVIRAEALHRFSQSLAQPVDKNTSLDPRERTTYLSIIGSLADLYWRTAYPEQQYTQAKLITDLEDYEGFPGMSERTLKDKLRDGKKIIETGRG